MDNERGSAFVVTLLVFCVVLVLGIGILGSAVTNTWMGKSDRDYQSVFYIAESGRDYAVEGLEKAAQDSFEAAEDAAGFFGAIDDYLGVSGNITIPTGVFDNQFGESVAAAVTVEGIGDWDEDDTEHTYTIVSEGGIGGVRRQVASEITLRYVPGVMQGSYISDVALFSLNGISVTQGSWIKGPIGTNSTEDGAINLGGTTTVTGILLREDADSQGIFANPTDYNYYKDKLIDMQEERTFPLPQYPGIPSLIHRSNINMNGGAVTVSQDGQYNSIKVAGGGVLTINAGSDGLDLVVDDLEISGGARISVTGTGMLNLYVTGTFTVNNGGTFNMGGNDRRVMIYYSGTDTFSPMGGASCVASVYVKTADIDFTNSFSVTGHIISGGSDVHFAGSSSSTGSMIYAPNAELRMDNSGLVKGAVIVKNCTMVGSSSIEYNSTVTMEDVPGITFPFTAPTMELDIEKATERDY